MVIIVYFFLILRKRMFWGIYERVRDVPPMNHVWKVTLFQIDSHWQGLV